MAVRVNAYGPRRTDHERLRTHSASVGTSSPSTRMPHGPRTTIEELADAAERAKRGHRGVPW